MLSIPDMALLGAAALLFFGPDQLPKVARKAGSVMRDIQNTSQSFIREMERAADLADAPASKPYEPPSYDPAPYDAPAYDAVSYDDLPTAPFPAVDPAAPDPEAPAVGEKLAEPRPALGFTEPAPPQPIDVDGLHPQSLYADDPAPKNSRAAIAEPEISHPAEPAPEPEHPAHL
jgi:Sec-independent protein translocase protein TatA